MTYTCNYHEFLDEMTKNIDDSNRNILKNGALFNINESCKNQKSEILTDILNKLIENPNDKVIVNNENWNIITSIESDHVKIFNTICQKANSIYELKLDIKKFRDEFNTTTKFIMNFHVYKHNVGKDYSKLENLCKKKTTLQLQQEGTAQETKQIDILIDGNTITQHQLDICLQMVKSRKINHVQKKSDLLVSPPGLPPGP